jgi:hypothetical protein
MITTAVITAMDTTVNPTVHCEQDKSKREPVYLLYPPALLHKEEREWGLGVKNLFIFVIGQHYFRAPRFLETSV